MEEKIPFKKELYDFVKQAAEEVKAAGVTINTGFKASPKSAADFGADVLIVAVGADKWIPEVPGLDDKSVLGIEDLRLGTDAFGKKVVIIGAGLVGCETAILLLREGRDVTLFEAKDDFAGDAPRFHRDAIEKELKDLGAEILLSVSIEKLTRESLRTVVHFTESSGEKRLMAADTVFAATGLKADTALVDAFRTAAPVVHVIGDADGPAQIVKATEQAYYAALDI